MSKSKTSKDKYQNDELMISIATFGLGILVLMLLVAVDRPHWFVKSAELTQGRPASAFSNKPAMAGSAVRKLPGG